MGLSVASFIAGLVIAAAAVGMLARRSVVRTRQAEQRARSAERMAEIGAMTAGLAHEIKNPLSTLGLNAQLLKEAIEELEAPADDKGRLVRRVDSMQREADRLRGILTDFLEYAGELRFDLAPADLNELATELSDFFLPQAEQQGVRLRVTLEESAGPIRVRVDAAHLKQAVLNLLLNAVQAMAEQELTRELLLRTEATTEGGVLRVIDTGPGMDAAKQAEVFKPYYSTKAGGTGLGLPTTRRLIEGQGGTLELHSEPSRGTEFVVTVPLDQAD